MTTIHRPRYLIAETAISCLMNVVISLLAAITSGGGAVAVPTFATIRLQTFMVAFMSVLIATLLTRFRLRRRRFNLRGDRRSRLGHKVPHNALLRASIVAVMCLLVAAPFFANSLPMLLAAAGGPGSIATGLVIAGYALLLSVLVTPPALILALDEDGPWRASPSS